MLGIIRFCYSRAGEIQGQLSCEWGGCEGYSQPVRGGTTFIFHVVTHGLHDPMYKYGQRDTHTDPSCCRATDPDVVIGSSLGLDVTMAPGGSTDLSELDDPSSSMVPRLQPDPMWWFRQTPDSLSPQRQKPSQTSTQILVTAGSQT